MVDYWNANIWFSFFTKQNTNNHKYTVAYLPVQEMFCQVKDKAKALKTDLVLDHAFYCKAVEIVMNEREITLDHLST